MILADAACVSTGRVREVARIGRYRVMRIDAAEIADAVRPGQFISLEHDAPGRILRRPFSALGASEGSVEIGFDVVGEGTRALATLASGDYLRITGPLGKPYTTPGAGTALLVGGGYGAAPLIFLAERLRGSGVQTHMILGAATQARLFLPDRAKAACGQLTITTDDGSEGIRGLVTDVMTGATYDTVYACGPMGMLSAVTAVTREDASVEVAVEEFMACGIGICWTCVVPTGQDGYRKHVRSCIEGPVFDGRELVWA